MRFTIILLFILTQINFSHAEVLDRASFWYVLSDTLDAEMNRNEAEFVFQVNFEFNRSSSARHSNERIIYGDGEIVDTVYLDSNSQFKLSRKPGKYHFELYVNSDYQELSFDMNIDSKHRKTIQIHFPRADRRELMKKPVIYLYPEVATEVNLKVTPFGEMTFTYPKYDGEWIFSAQPDGKLKMNDKVYNYLFWEAQIDKDRVELNDDQDGFVVDGNSIVTFLEDKLSQIGLTASEQADFITFWAPMMQNKENLFIRFVMNDECDNIAELDIQPDPDQVNRVYMLWSEYDGNNNPIPQELIEFNREGFDVLEWGGQEMYINYTSDVN